MLLISIDSGRGYEAMRGLAETLEIPLISLTAPLYPQEKQQQRKHFEVSVRPSSTELLADLIIYKRWTEVFILTDGEHSGISLPWLWHHLHKKSNSSTTAQLLELPKDPNKFSEFLQSFNLRRFNETNRILIDTTSSSRQQKFLSAVRTAQFSQTNYHYVVANFDFLSYDVETFQNGNINITGFQLINKESRAYWNLKRHLRKLDDNFINNYDDVDSRGALAHDAMLVAWKGFAKCLASNDSLFHGTFRHGRFFNRGYPGIYCDPLADRAHPSRPFASFEHGRTVMKALRTLSIDSKDGTLTGNIEFDRFGQRKNYDVSVIDLVSNTKATFNRKEILVWRQGTGFFTDRTVAQHTRKAVENRNKNIVRVVTVWVAPFVMTKRECLEQNNRTECQGNNKYEGYCIDLLKLLADRIEGFNFEVYLVDKTGSRLPDGNWDGMMGDLLNGRADVAVASLTINQERERVVDFSKPFMTTGISIMIKKPDKQEFSVFSFMQPLSTEIWMYIIFAYIGVSVVIFLVSRFSPYEWRVEETARGGFTISNDFSVYNCLWFTLAAFMQQGTDILPRSVSGRIASSAWWFFTMIIVSSYTANLAAFLTLEKMQAPIESVEDLAKQTKIKYGIQGGGSTASFFKYSSVQIYQRMWRYMESQVPSVFVSSYAEGIERVRSHKGRYAFLLEATANEYENTRKPCDTMKVGANLNSIGYGVATPFGSDWKDHINLAILALQERGELKKLENKWWYDRGQCDQGITVDGSSASLNLSKVAGIFYILMGGMIASMIAALGEFLYRSRIEARKANPNSLVGNFAKSLKSALSSQLRLSIKGGAFAEPGTQSYEALKRQQTASFLPASNNEKNEDVDVTNRSSGLTSTFAYNTAV
uniref:Glutamate receptor 1 n=1 Tax=Angiostrongylus cantonensis TaxID=6313 RepID=A0A0K0CTY1_ANGCA